LIDSVRAGQAGGAKTLMARFTRCLYRQVSYHYTESLLLLLLLLLVVVVVQWRCLSIRMIIRRIIGWRHHFARRTSTLLPWAGAAS